MNFRICCHNAAEVHGDLLQHSSVYWTLSSASTFLLAIVRKLAELNAYRPRKFPSQSRLPIPTYKGKRQMAPLPQPKLRLNPELTKSDNSFGVNLKDFHKLMDQSYVKKRTWQSLKKPGSDGVTLTTLHGFGSEINRIYQCQLTFAQLCHPSDISNLEPKIRDVVVTGRQLSDCCKEFPAAQATVPQIQWQNYQTGEGVKGAPAQKKNYKPFILMAAATPVLLLIFLFNRNGLETNATEPLNPPIVGQPKRHTTNRPIVEIIPETKLPSLHKIFETSSIPLSVRGSEIETSKATESDVFSVASVHRELEHLADRHSVAMDPYGLKSTSMDAVEAFSKISDGQPKLDQMLVRSQILNLLESPAQALDLCDEILASETTLTPLFEFDVRSEAFLAVRNCQHMGIFDSSMTEVAMNHLGWIIEHIPDVEDTRCPYVIWTNAYSYLNHLRNDDELSENLYQVAGLYCLLQSTTASVADTRGGEDPIIRRNAVENLYLMLGFIAEAERINSVVYPLVAELKSPVLVELRRLDKKILSPLQQMRVIEGVCRPIMTSGLPSMAFPAEQIAIERNTEALEHFRSNVVPLRLQLNGVTETYLFDRLNNDVELWYAASLCGAQRYSEKESQELVNLIQSNLDKWRNGPITDFDRYTLFSRLCYACAVKCMVDHDKVAAKEDLLQSWEQLSHWATEDLQRQSQIGASAANDIAQTFRELCDAGLADSADLSRAVKLLILLSGDGEFSSNDAIESTIDLAERFPPELSDDLISQLIGLRKFSIAETQDMNPSNIEQERSDPSKLKLPFDVDQAKKELPELVQKLVQLIEG